jgi:hypothetical protein
VSRLTLFISAVSFFCGFMTRGLLAKVSQARIKDITWPVTKYPVEVGGIINGKELHEFVDGPKVSQKASK